MNGFAAKGIGLNVDTTISNLPRGVLYVPRAILMVSTSIAIPYNRRERGAPPFLQSLKSHTVQMYISRCVQVRSLSLLALPPTPVLCQDSR